MIKILNKIQWIFDETTWHTRSLCLRLPLSAVVVVAQHSWRLRYMMFVCVCVYLPWLKYSNAWYAWNEVCFHRVIPFLQFFQFPKQTPDDVIVHISKCIEREYVIRHTIHLLLSHSQQTTATTTTKTANFVLFVVVVEGGWFFFAWARLLWIIQISKNDIWIRMD